MPCRYNLSDDPVQNISVPKPRELGPLLPAVGEPRQLQHQTQQCPLPAQRQCSDLVTKKNRSETIIWFTTIVYNSERFSL